MSGQISCQAIHASPENAMITGGAKRRPSMAPPYCERRTQTTSVFEKVDPQTGHHQCFPTFAPVCASGGIGPRESKPQTGHPGCILGG